MRKFGVKQISACIPPSVHERLMTRVREQRTTLRHIIIDAVMAHIGPDVCPMWWNHATGRLQVDKPD
jgi:hypothetical protein